MEPFITALTAAGDTQVDRQTGMREPFITVLTAAGDTQVDRQTGEMQTDRVFKVVMKVFSRCGYRCLTEMQML